MLVLSGLALMHLQHGALPFGPPNGGCGLTGSDGSYGVLWTANMPNRREFTPRVIDVDGLFQRSHLYPSVIVPMALVARSWWWRRLCRCLLIPRNTTSISTLRCSHYATGHFTLPDAHPVSVRQSTLLDSGKHPVVEAMSRICAFYSALHSAHALGNVPWADPGSSARIGLFWYYGRGSGVEPDMLSCEVRPG